MATDLTLAGYRPPPRYPPDNAPWQTARIDEAPDRAGPWTTIEPAFALNPPVTDPANPPTYNFTTTGATLERGWYRVVFADTAGVLAVSAPTQNVPAYTTVDDLRLALAPGGVADPGTASALSDGELADAVGEAQSEVDARLSDRGAPYAEGAVPALVAQITRDLAAFKATLVHRKGHPVEPNDPVRLRYDHALALLRQIGTGEVDLPGTVEEGTSESALLNPYDGALFQLDDFALGSGSYGLRLT
jgi:phage gp36-like protein